MLHYAPTCDRFHDQLTRARKIAIADVDMSNVRASFDAFITTLRASHRVVINDDVHASYTYYHDTLAYDRDNVAYVTCARADVSIDDVTHFVFARLNTRTGRIEHARWNAKSYERYNA
jgi:hypothetical protein